MKIIFFFLLFGKLRAAVNVSNAMPMISTAYVSLTINEILSPYNFEQLTQISPEQCRPWTDVGAAPTLTWSVESRLLLFSDSNLYEANDYIWITNPFAQLSFTPHTLSINRAGFTDPVGLGYYLSLNATPFCSSTRLPTKTLCNDGFVTTINKTTTAVGNFMQTMCSGRFTFSYRYSYTCANEYYSPPSCKAKCTEIRNTTHCYACDEHSGAKICCSGASAPDCRNKANDPAFKNDAGLSGGAIAAIACLSVLCALLLIISFVIIRLLLREKSKRESKIQPTGNSPSAGWTSNGHVPKKHNRNHVVDLITAPNLEKETAVYVVDDSRRGTPIDQDFSNDRAVTIATLNQQKHLNSRQYPNGSKIKESSEDLYASVTLQKSIDQQDDHAIDNLDPRILGQPSLLSVKPLEKKFGSHSQDLGTLF